MMTEQADAHDPRLAARRRRRAERKRLRRAEMAESTALRQAASRPMVRSLGAIAGSSAPLGPFAAYVGRIASRMAVGHVLRLIIRVLVRRI